MRKNVTKVRYLDRWLIGENEHWFTHMSEQGLHLKWLSGSFAHFEQGEPKEYRYRIDFASTKDGVFYPAQLDLYEKNGWERVDIYDDMCVFRSPASAGAPELHTDPAEQSHTLRRLNKRLIFHAIATPVISIGGILLIYLLLFSRYPVYRLIEPTNQVFFIYFILYFVCCYNSTRELVLTRRIIRALREGRPIDHQADWRKAYAWNKSFRIAYTVINLAIISLPVASLMLYRADYVPPNGYDYRIIRLSDVEGRYEAEILYSSAKYSNSASFYWSIFAPVKITAYEGFGTPGTASPNGPYLDYSIYQLSFSEMGEPLLRDLLKISENMERLLDRTPLVESYSYLAYDRVFIREEGYESELYLCKGRYVVHALYKGDKALTDVFGAVDVLFSRLPE